MPTGFIIKSVVNPLDGQNIAVALDGIPSGIAAFRICRTPDFALSVPADSVLTGNAYLVATPHPTLWYVWATDSNGTVDAPGCAWSGLSNEPDLDLCGKKLAEILTANIPALNACLASYFQDATVKHVVYGNAAAIKAYPAILVTKPVIRPQYTAMPWVRRITFQFDIMFTILHQDAAPQLTAAVRFVSRMVEILNQPAYEGLVLDSGTPLAFCQCQEGEADESQYEENKWCATGSLVWSGDAMLQDSV